MHFWWLELFISKNTPINVGLTKILRGDATFCDEPFSTYVEIYMDFGLLSINHK